MRHELVTTKLIDMFIEFILYRHDKLRCDWMVLMDDGTTYERIDQPCYGEMRPYAYGNEPNGPFEPELLPENQRKVRKPTDLYHPFPKGHPILLAVPFVGPYKNTPKTILYWNEMMLDVVLNPEVSPWRDVLKDVIVVRNNNNIVCGIIICDTHINPTTMVNLFRKIKRHHRDSLNGYIILREKHPELSKLEAFVLAQMIHIKSFISFSRGNDYTSFPDNPEFWRIFKGAPIDTTGGTWYDRYAYDRPKNDFIFGNVKEDDKKLYRCVGAALKSLDALYTTVPFDKLPVIVEEFVKLVRA